MKTCIERAKEWRKMLPGWLNNNNLRLVINPLVFCYVGVCPVLCSGHGSYGGGRCHCEVGWAGVECDLPSSESTDIGISSSSSSGTGFVISCSIPCSIHGTCVNGRCQCDVEHTGASCETRKFTSFASIYCYISYSGIELDANPIPARFANLIQSWHYTTLQERRASLLA